MDQVLEPMGCDIQGGSVEGSFVFCGVALRTQDLVDLFLDLR
jgi:hypothetical protein